MAVPTIYGRLGRVLGRCAALLAALGIGACTYQAEVPAINGANLGEIGGPEPGRYAVLVQKDAWAVKVDIEGLTCWPHSYDVDVDRSWSEAMKNALVTALGKVDFVDAIKPPASLTVPYDAQIGVVQSDATAHVAVAPKLFGLDAEAQARLVGALTIVYPDGSFQYETVEGTGTARSNGFTCAAAASAIEQAGADALRGIVQRVALTAKLRLAQHRPGGNRIGTADRPRPP